MRKRLFLSNQADDLSGLPDCTVLAFSVHHLLCTVLTVTVWFVVITVCTYGAPRYQNVVSPYDVTGYLWCHIVYLWCHSVYLWCPVCVHGVTSYGRHVLVLSGCL